jgi:hypothetical protein
VNPGTLAARNLLYQAGKLNGGSDGTVVNDVPRYPPAVTLFTVSLYELSQLLLRQSVDDVRCG